MVEAQVRVKGEKTDISKQLATAISVMQLKKIETPTTPYRKAPSQVFESPAPVTNTKTYSALMNLIPEIVVEQVTMSPPCKRSKCFDAEHIRMEEQLTDAEINFIYYL